jgi:predicted esterase
MAKSLRAKFPEEKLHILVAKRNSGSFTYDGIELGGERVCQEIEEEVEKLARAGQQIKRLSLVGYSLGGLVARFCVGLLDSKEFFEKITPVVCFPTAYVIWIQY